MNEFFYGGERGKIHNLPDISTALDMAFDAVILDSGGRSESQITAGFLDRTLCGSCTAFQFNRQA